MEEEPDALGCIDEGGIGDLGEVEGKGQTRSADSGEQKGRILLYKYYCLSSDRPAG